MRRDAKILIALGLLSVCFFAGCAGSRVAIQRKIAKDFWKQPQYKETCSAEDFSVRIVSSFDDVHVVFVDGPFAYLDVVTYEYVDGLEFSYPDSQKMMVYYGGEFFWLDEAFERRLLTSDEIRETYKAYEKYATEEHERP